MRLPEPPILLISDRRRAKAPIAEELAAAVAGGCRWIMLREKDLPEEDLMVLVEEVQSALAGQDVFLTVNSAMGLVARLGLAGLHLPAAASLAAARRALGPDVLIGQSAHSLAAVTRAATAADYATISPVFSSISKDDSRESLGPKGLRAICRGSPIPLLALGGIALENLVTCRQAGAAGAAVLGAVIGQDDPEAAMADLIAAWHSAAL